MTHGRCFPGEAGGAARTAARVTAAVLVIATMLAVLWAGPAASAGASRAQTLASGSSRHAKVKYYIVPKPGNGPPVALYGIAVRTLGSSRRYIEIFNLNKGRLQPNGGRLENPHTIDPGWILQLPADASGPGVHFGRLPGRKPSPTPPASPRPSESAAGGAAAPRSQLKSSLSASEILAGGALLLFAIAGLAFWISRRRGAAARRRKHSRARPPVPQDGIMAGAADTAPDLHGTDPHRADPRWPGADQPSRPGARPGPQGGEPPWPGTEHPGRASAPQRQPAAEHPSWPDGPQRQAGHPGPPVPGQPGFPGADPRLARAGHPAPPPADHPSWPSADHPSWPGAHPAPPPADHPSWPGGGHPSFPRAADRSAGPRHDPAAGPHNARREQAAPAIVGLQEPDGSWGPPEAQPDTGRRWPAQVVRAAEPVAQAYPPAPSGDGRLQVVLNEAPASGWTGRAGLGARSQDLVQLTGGEAAQLAQAIRRDAVEVRNAHSLWLAGRMLSGAENQAAEIRQEAYEQAAALRAAAERETAEARQRAAALRATAEAEAAELLTAAQTIQSELGRVAAYVTESLTSPGMPVTKPPAWPGARPGGRPAARPAAEPGAEPAAEPAGTPAGPDAKPAARPGAKPAARPGAKPAGRPGAKPAARPGAPSARPDTGPGTKQNGRQVNAIRKMVIALVAVFLVGVISGVTEIGMHGFSFFLFRNAGAGAGNSQNLNENQGPGQPDAPGTQHKTHVIKPAGQPDSRPGKSN